MSHKKWIVTLTAEQRVQLLDIVKKGNTSVRRLNRAHALLLASEDKPDTAIADALHIGVSTVERIRQRFVEGGMERALNEQPRPKRGGKLDERSRAVLVATACSKPPDGRARWTLRLLADRMVELGIVDRISHECVRQELKKTVSNPG